MGSLRDSLKATPIKNLKSKINEDNSMLGGSNEYIQLQDGKTLKLRIFPAHPGEESFYVSKMSYWLSIAKSDGDLGRMTVLDSVAHGGTEKDIVREFISFSKKKWANNNAKLEAFTADKDSLRPSFTWLCYAGEVVPNEKLSAMIWEFKKTVRDQINKLSISEDQDEPIEIDPFTDPDEGIPIFVKYISKPNKKKGENYYDVSVGNKPKALILSDESIEHFMKLKPLSELIHNYDLKEFERALEGLENFDEEHGLEVFEDDAWLEIVEKVRAQYSSEEDEDPKPKKTSAKEEPKKKTTSKKVVEVEEEDEEEPEPEEAEDVSEGDQFDEMDRDELKAYIKENELEIKIFKSDTEESLREKIRAVAVPETEDEDEESEDEPEEVKPKSKISLADIKNKLANNKKK